MNVVNVDRHGLDRALIGFGMVAMLLLVSCGGLRTLEIIGPLEEACRVPVVSSTPHALWAGMRLLGLHVKTPGFGRLIANG